jgi:predicted small lipoprotein YifL
MIRRWLAVLFLAVLCLGTLGACGRKGDPEAPPGAYPNAPTVPNYRDERNWRK